MKAGRINSQLIGAVQFPHVGLHQNLGVLSIQRIPPGKDFFGLSLGTISLYSPKDQRCQQASADIYKITEICSQNISF